MLKRDKALKAAEKAAAAKTAKAKSTDEKLREREAAAKAKEVRFHFCSIQQQMDPL